MTSDTKKKKKDIKCFYSFLFHKKVFFLTDLFIKSNFSGFLWASWKEVIYVSSSDVGSADITRSDVLNSTLNHHLHKQELPRLVLKSVVDEHTSVYWNQREHPGMLFPECGFDSIKRGKFIDCVNQGKVDNVLPQQPAKDVWC